MAGPNGTEDPHISTNVYAMAFDLVSRFDAFRDNPWPILYRELDQEYPGSKFVLSVRASEAWIASQVRHFGAAETPMRRWIYGFGFPKGDEETYIRRYEGHNAAVRSHFEARPNDLLVMDLAAGDGWAKLCAFLGKQAPATPFPHANMAEKKEQMDRPAAR